MLRKKRRLKRVDEDGVECDASAGGFIRPAHLQDQPQILSTHSDKKHKAEDEPPPPPTTTTVTSDLDIELPDYWRVESLIQTVWALSVDACANINMPPIAFEHQLTSFALLKKLTDLPLDLPFHLQQLRRLHKIRIIHTNILDTDVNMIIASERFNSHCLQVAAALRQNDPSQDYRVLDVYVETVLAQWVKPEIEADKLKELLSEGLSKKDIPNVSEGALQRHLSTLLQAGFIVGLSQCSREVFRICLPGQMRFHSMLRRETRLLTDMLKKRRYREVLLSDLLSGLSVCIGLEYLLSYLEGVGLLIVSWLNGHELISLVVK